MCSGVWLEPASYAEVGDVEALKLSTVPEKWWRSFGSDHALSGARELVAVQRILGLLSTPGCCNVPRTIRLRVQA